MQLATTCDTIKPNQSCSLVGGEVERPHPTSGIETLDCAIDEIIQCADSLANTNLLLIQVMKESIRNTKYIVFKSRVQDKIEILNILAEYDSEISCIMNEFFASEYQQNKKPENIVRKLSATASV